MAADGALSLTRSCAGDFLQQQPSRGSNPFAGFCPLSPPLSAVPVGPSVAINCKTAAKSAEQRLHRDLNPGLRDDSAVS